jgi:tetratricopeptide (TPR) repeat protein
MECRRIAPNIVRVATLIAMWVVIALAFLQAAIGTARADMPVGKDYAALAHHYEMQYRSGNVEVVPQYVAAMDEATQLAPDNADNWYRLGRAYMAVAARALAENKPGEAMPAMQKGPAALMRALKLNPQHAPALVQIGGVQTMLGPVLKKPEWVTRGIDQMNQAVKIAPDSMRVRLQRAFLGVNLPDELRNRDAEAQDLDYVIENSDWGTAVQYVMILRGDLHAENGDLQQAASYYRSVRDATSPASPEANSRLTALAMGAVPQGDIKHLRTAAGAQCAMCHGR